MQVDQDYRNELITDLHTLSKDECINWLKAHMQECGECKVTGLSKAKVQTRQSTTDYCACRIWHSTG